MHLHRPLPISIFKRQTSMNTISEHQISVCLILSHTNILVVRESERNLVVLRHGASKTYRTQNGHLS